jgi:predicted nuclease of predicted toxin-antitoxin system
MKLLFDQNLSFKLARKLADVFPGSSQVKLLGLEEADDRDIWNYARQNGFTLATKDADYYEKSALLGHPPKVIWLRCGNQPTITIERLIRAHLEEIRAFEQDPTAGCLEIY